MTFRDLGLSEDLLSALERAQFVSPTPIQEQAIPPALGGRDVLGIAQTGTGKTAAFLLPSLERLAKGRARARMPRMLILEPTRELAAQVAEQFEVLAEDTRLNMALLIGGVSFSEQEAKLNRGVDVLIATPGRLLDHFERGKVLLTGVQVMVVDEADRMLDMGFIPDIERIFSLTPPMRQTLFFSATMPAEIQRLTEKFLSAAIKIEIARPATVAATVAQQFFDVGSNDDAAKRAGLRTLLRREADELTNAIVFCNRKRDVDVVAKSLKSHGFSAEPIHGDLPQSQRNETLEAFRKNEVTILVASDVAARGLDVPGVSHVFNYDVPYHPDDYVHRIGRTGRAGRSGKAMMLVAPGDSKHMDNVESLVGEKLTTEPLELDEQEQSTRKEGSSKPKARSSDKSNKRESKSEPAKAASGEAASGEAASGEAASGEDESGQKSRGRRGGGKRADRNGKSSPRQSGRDFSQDSWGNAIPSFLTRSVAPALRATKAQSNESAEEPIPEDAESTNS
jgi:ATP-dependent RNA helicase RhlE